VVTDDRCGGTHASTRMPRFDADTHDQLAITTLPQPAGAETPPPRLAGFRRTLGRDGAWLIACAAVYLALAMPTLPAFGILWDEQVDLEIARSYVHAPTGWLSDPGEDAINLRLPMYTGAVAFALLDRDDVIVGRAVSCGVTLLTLAAVFVYARRFGRVQAFVAAALVATSPFILAFSRVAFTEGDAFVTAGLAWSLVLVAAAVERPTLGRATLAGVVYGLAIASKFAAISLLPAIALAPWLVAPRVAYDPRLRPLLGPLAVAAGALAAQVLTLGWFYWYRPQRPEQAVLVFLAWAAAAAAYGASIAWLARRRHQPVGRLTLPAIVVLVAGATAILVPPVHLTEPILLGSLKNRIVEASALDPVHVVQAASLHGLTLLFKPSLAVGLVLWLSLAVALWRWRVDASVRLPLLFIGAHLAFLLKMPTAQTFYTMPIAPWLMVLAADRLVAWWHRRRTLAVLVAAACTMGVASDLWRTFPHYQLNGYQWLGARYVLGLSTLSYRSVAQVTTDGIEQALHWANAHVPPGAHVKTFIQATPILRALAPELRYTIVDGFRPPSPTVDDVDYVITTLHGEIRRTSRAGLRGGGPIFEYPYDRDTLTRDFEPVFRVERPFGLEFATVWQRKDGLRASTAESR
jgi:hypothetical protein